MPKLLSPKLIGRDFNEIIKAVNFFQTLIEDVILLVRSNGTFALFSEPLRYVIGLWVKNCHFDR